MRKDKSLKLIAISFIVPLLIILSITLIDQSERKNLVTLYDFEDDQIGDYPKGFVGVLRDTEYTRVINFDETHGNVVEIRYLKANIINPIEIYGGVEFNTLFGLTDKGIIEFDIYGLFHKKINIDVCQTDGEYDYRDDIVINIRASGNIAIRDNDQYREVKRFVTENWYHFKIQFDIEKGWILWINDDVIQFNRYTFEEQPPYFCQLYFATYELGNVFYVDNIKIILDQPPENIYPLDVYIPIIIIIFLSMIVLVYFFKFSKLKRN